MDFVTSIAFETSMLKSCLKKRGSFFLFVAPPAWGKTRMLIDLHRSGEFLILYISPLKALVMDFYSSLESVPCVTLINKRANFDRLWRSSGRGEMLLCTAEVVGRVEYREKMLVIFDEFHLFYYWGQSFREHLFDIVMDCANKKIPILGLTATMNQHMYRVWRRDFLCASDHVYIQSFGNQVLKNHPNRIISYLSKKQISKRLIWELMQKKGVTILFCAYRNEVDEWVIKLKKWGVVTLGCKGGEVDQFVLGLKKIKNLNCIVTTTALSHGVNLPEIRNVFIDYRVGNKDFWIQMVGRGGRLGNSYSIFTRDFYYLTFCRIVFQSLMNLAIDVLIRAGLYFTTCRPR